MRKRKYKAILYILILVLLAINYNHLDSFVIKNFDNQETITVERVIDGDTIVDNNDLHYRLLGINTPERGEYLYLEAKKFLEENTLNFSLTAEKKGKDRYDRELAYLYNGDKNINIEIVREGYANYYFPSGKDRHYEEFYKAWEECLNENKNLCEKSLDKCSSCIELNIWDFENQKVVLYNKCNFDCSLNKWTIKDEGRKKFTFSNFILKSLESVSIIVENKTNTKDKLYWKGETYVWTSSGDTLLLRDDKGKLVLWESDGY
jgi:endonuclease YncB( thermonuclease family)